jgi:hypothetical protein
MILRRSLCSNHDAVASAARTGPLGGALAVHAAGCPDCAATAAVVRFVVRAAEPAPGPRRLPDAAALWWKARLVHRWSAEREASAPVDRMRLVELLAAVAGLLVSIVFLWHDAAKLLAIELPSLPAWPLQPILMPAAIGVALVSITAMLMLDVWLAD